MMKKGNWGLFKWDGEPVSVGAKVQDYKGVTHTIVDGTAPSTKGYVGQIVVDDGVIMNPQALDVFWVEDLPEAV